MTANRNPYIAGGPVDGLNFYGREKDLPKVLEADDKLLLFAGTRRIGKTSFCRQIKYKCDTEPRYSHFACMDWNLQGQRNVDIARRRLLSPSNRKRLPEVDWDTARSDKMDCCGVIQTVCETYENGSNSKTVLLLMDEPETLQHFVETENYDFLGDLKFVFDDIFNLRVVIVGSPKLPDLLSRSGCPYLLDNFRTHFLRGFSDPEAEELIRLVAQKAKLPLAFLESGEHVVEDIIEVSNKVPFFIQLICQSIFDAHPGKSPSQVLETLIEKQVFTRFFTSDFGQLHPIQKIMVLKLANTDEPWERAELISAVKEVASPIRGQIPSQKHIDSLASLGVIRRFEGSKVHLANPLFDKWLRRDLENLYNDVMQHVDKEATFVGEKMPHARLKRQELAAMKAALGALESTLAQLRRDFTDKDVTEAFYYQKSLALVRDRALTIAKLRDHLRGFDADALALVLDRLTLERRNDKTIWVGLEAASAEGHKKGWGDVVDSVIRDRSQDPVQAVTRAAFSLAEHLAR